jgi:hypothetical protein
MATFQKITLMIAGILLLICIIIIILIFLFPNTKQVWPPLLANCPDYFVDLKGDGSNCVNKLSLGNCSNIPDFTQPPYIGSGGNCVKYTWANKCKLTWDGLTYGVQNPCTTSTTTTTTS